MRRFCAQNPKNTRLPPWIGTIHGGLSSKFGSKAAKNYPLHYLLELLMEDLESLGMRLAKYLSMELFMEDLESLGIRLAKFPHTPALR